MTKIFQTQLTGLIQGLDQYSDSFEDAARVISQTIISEGRIWIYGELEMKGIISQALDGVDTIPSISQASNSTTFSNMDTLLIFSPNSSSQAVMDMVEKAKGSGAEVIGVSSKPKGIDNNEQHSWTEECSFTFFTGVQHGLVPTESGEKIGKPHLLVALHIYYVLFFTVMEFLEEYGV